MLIDVLSLLPESWVRHLPVLVVLGPMLLSPICAAMPKWRIAWALALFGIITSSVFAFALLQDVMAHGRISYALGGWAPPHGIEFRIDALNVLVLLLVSSIALLTSIFSWPTIKAEIADGKRAMFFGAFQVCFMGLLGVAATGDAFNLFVFL